MRTIFILILVISIFSCKSDDDDDNPSNMCSVENPAEDLSWLREKIKELEETSSFQEGNFYISQTNYKNNTVFIFGNCCEVCNTVIPVYNCEGEFINILGCKDNYIDFSLLNNATIIWSPPNFMCKASNNFSYN